jgi:hypothetical protein
MEREYTPIVDFFKYSTRPLFLRIFKSDIIHEHLGHIKPWNI